jgi:hypothetical protein
VTLLSPTVIDSSHYARISFHVLLNITSFSRFRVPSAEECQRLRSTNPSDDPQAEFPRGSDSAVSVTVSKGADSTEPLLCILEDERYLLNYDS